MMTTVQAIDLAILTMKNTNLIPDTRDEAIRLLEEARKKFFVASPQGVKHDESRN